MIIPFGFMSTSVDSAPLDYTNLLENTTDIDADFDFYDSTGTIQSGISVRNTNGDWCLETTGSTPSNTTGATTNPTDRTAFIYYESGTASSSGLAVIKRNTSLNNSNQDVKVDLIVDINMAVSSVYYFEYAIIDAHNDTTDWTTLETVQGRGTSNPLWENKTFDLSVAPSTATLWLRIRFLSTNYQGDVSFSTWREYK